MWANSAGVSRNILQFLLLGLASLAVSCSGNLLTELANTTDDDALLQGVKIAMAEGDYDGAVTKCTQMTTTFQAGTDAIYSCASAYAGRAGLDTLDLVNDLAAASASATDRLIQYMMKQNHGAVAQDVTDLTTAITLIQSLGRASVRSSEMNALITLASLHALGIIANAYADTNDDDSIDGGYDSCDNTDLPTAGGTLAVNAFWEINESAGLSGIPGGSDIATVISTACAALGAQDFCAQTDPTAFTANQLKGARSLLAENLADFGIGDCVNPGCVCP